jgi:hypothetical protein
MSWTRASQAIWFVVLLLHVSAQQQPLAPDSSTENGATRQSTISSQAAQPIILGHGSLLSSVGKEQLAQVKAASAFQGSLETLAAQLDADDDLVGGTLVEQAAV